MCDRGEARVPARSSRRERRGDRHQRGTGSSTTWTKDVVDSSDNTTSSTTVTFPSLTPSSTHEFYVGMAQVASEGEAGSTSGFTYDVTSPNENLYIYNPSVSSSVSPTARQTSSGASVAVGALVEASGTTSTTDSAWDVVAGGSVPLNINDATTTGSTTTNVSYIYGDLLFGGTAPIEQITTTSSGATAVFLVSDQSGVQGVFSSSGVTDELAVYSPYGTQTITAGSDVTPFGFQGSYKDSTGLIYLINRYYDPSTDQFLSIDPDVATTDQPYVFTNDDPLNAEDPLGLGIGSDVVHFVVKVSKAIVKGVAKGIASLVPQGTGMAMGVCGGVSGGGNGAGGKVTVCAGSTGNGKAFSSVTVGGGTNTGGASVGVGLMFSNAQDASQLGKKFTYAGASVGDGPSASLDFEEGKSSNNNVVYIISPGIGFGLSPGFTYQQGVSWTWAKGYN